MSLPGVAALSEPPLSVGEAEGLLLAEAVRALPPRRDVMALGRADRGQGSGVQEAGTGTDRAAGPWRGRGLLTLIFSQQHGRTGDVGCPVPLVC